MSENEPAVPETSNRGNGLSNWLLAIGGLAVLSGILYFGFFQTPEGPEEAPVAVTPAVPIALPAPEIDEPPPAEPVIPAAPLDPEPAPAPPPVTLAASDEVIAEQIDSLGGGQISAQFVQRPNNLERAIAIVDNLRQGAVPYKLLPVGRPSKAFPFQDNGLAVTMDPAGYGRYSGLADTIASLDTSAIVGLYQLLTPAINEVWDLLGYEAMTFEDAALAALGMIMLAPAPDPESRLIKVEANWVYEDEALESLPPLQKQLMRMGAENAEKVQDKARELRGALLDLASAEAV